MAVKRLNPKTTIKIVSQYDSALDLPPSTVEGEESPAWKEFVESFDLSVLKFKDGEEPSIFHVRPLLNTEMAEINEKYVHVDTAKKKVELKRYTSMLLEMFDIGCVGMEEKDAEGKIKLVQIKSDEIPYRDATSLGSLVSILTNLGERSKKG